MSQREPFASPAFVETSVWNYGAVAYPVESGGTLAIADGDVKLRYRLDFDHRGDPKNLAEGRYNLACQHRIADAAGAVWEARTCFRPDLFVHRLQDLNNLDWPVWAHHAPERVQAIAERPIITGISVLEDDRFYRRFWIDDTLLEINFKYQGLTIDVGQMSRSDSGRVAVRVSGFFGSWCYAPMEDDCYLPKWEGGEIRPPEQEYDGQENQTVEYPEEDVPGGWLENLSPIVYSLWEKEFLFRNDATWADDYPTWGTWPRPLAFRRVAGETADPQPNVTFRG